MHNNLDYSTTKAISNSSLNLLEISPRQFLKFYNQEFEEKDEKHFLLGSAIHCYVLEPEEFDKRYKFLKYNSPNSPNKKQFVETYVSSKKKGDVKLIEAYTKSYNVDSLKEETILEKAKELKKELSSYFKLLKYKKEGIEILPPHMQLYFSNLNKELKSNKYAYDLLYTDINPIKDIESFNELPIFWEYKNHNCKALLDRVVIDHDNKIIKLVDLKTTVDIFKFKDESFFKFHYDRQLAFYSLALIAYFEQNYKEKSIEDYSIEHYIVAVNKDTDVESTVFKISNNTILNASKQISKLLNTAIWHFENNKWEYSKEHYTEGYEVI